MSEGFASSRRQFFAVGAIAAAALPGASSIGAALTGKPLALQGLAEWQKHVGQQFVLEGKAPMTLVAVKPSYRQPSALRRSNSFTAVFETASAVDSDGIYGIAHETLGNTRLFLQPATNKAGKPTLRASFA